MVQQQQQVAHVAFAAQAGYPMVGNSPKKGYDDHYGIVVIGDQCIGKGYGWITTRVATLLKLLAAEAEANTPLKTGEGKTGKLSELNPDSCFTPQSLKAWYKALYKGPQPSPEDTEDNYTPAPIRAHNLAMFVF